MNTAAPAMIYVISMGIVALYQGCLAIGLPWGAASMGGKYPGKYPPRMRIAALVNIILLSILSIIVLVKSNLLLPKFITFSHYAIWVVVLFGLTSMYLNTFTKSKIERIWAPVSLIQFITSLIVALN